jgi:hypothetical protein
VLIESVHACQCAQKWAFCEYQDQTTMFLPHSNFFDVCMCVCMCVKSVHRRTWMVRISIQNYQPSMQLIVMHDTCGWTLARLLHVQSHLWHLQCVIDMMDEINHHIHILTHTGTYVQVFTYMYTCIYLHILRMRYHIYTHQDWSGLCSGHDVVDGLRGAHSRR